MNLLKNTVFKSIFSLFLFRFKQNAKVEIHSKQFKIITGIACFVGLTVPIFGVNPIKAQILTQVFNVFVLPLVILAMLILINRKTLMRAYKAGWALNIGMTLALIFACVISYNGVVAIIENMN